MMILKYAIFAIISTIINISCQYISFLIYDGFLSLYIAMFLGTFFALLAKYILDKKYIFFYKTTTKKENAQKFLIYSSLGIITTIIFLAFEIGFDTYFNNENAKYIGAIIGLTIGYISKYFLDKKFVFKD